MVLEHLLPEDWLEKRTRYAFLLAAGYSIIGIFAAKILFPADPALVAVAFISLLLLPELYKLFSIEERMEDREKRFSMKELWKDNKPFLKIYIFIFLGIFVVYAFSAIWLDSLSTNHLFREQLAMRNGSGNAAISLGLFWNLLVNNFWVMVACFFIALLTGDGAIFLITWNASVWGTIFGITAKNAAIYASVNPFYYFFVIMLIVTPHMLLEAMAYITASISGSVISKDVLLEKFESRRFNEVFLYNFMLFLFGILFLVLGALVEAYVLNNIGLYREIITQSMLSAGL
jgi:hypothetical protein